MTHLLWVIPVLAIGVGAIRSVLKRMKADELFMRRISQID